MIIEMLGSCCRAVVRCVYLCVCVCARARVLAVHLEDVCEEPHHILVVLSGNLSLEAVHLVHVDRFVVAPVEVEVQRIATLEGEEEEDHLDAAYVHVHGFVYVCVFVCVRARAIRRRRGGGSLRCCMHVCVCTEGRRRGHFLQR